MLKHYLVPLSTVIVSLYIDTFYRSPMSSSIIIPRPHLQLLLLLVVGVMVLSCATQGRQTPPPEDAHTLPLTADTVVADLSRDSLTTEITYGKYLDTRGVILDHKPRHDGAFPSRCSCYILSSGLSSHDRRKHYVLLRAQQCEVSVDEH